MEQEHTVTEQEQGVDAAAGAGEGTGEDVPEALARIEAEKEEVEEIRARIAEVDAAQLPERARKYMAVELELAARIVESRVEAARWWCTPRTDDEIVTHRREVAAKRALELADGVAVVRAQQDSWRGASPAEIAAVKNMSNRWIAGDALRSLWRTWRRESPGDSPEWTEFEQWLRATQW